MSEDSRAVVVENLHKSFVLPHEKTNGIKQAVLGFATRSKGSESQKVLNGISFEIKKGEFFGIVGRNGSGKSTLLKLLAGIYVPDSGLVQVNGALTPFIELGVGFNPELTGRENVYLNGALLGFSKSEMGLMFDDIVEFAELSRFMDQKLKNYSSGMQVRLAFSIAIRAESPILLLDEVLAVGDSVFQKKCYDYFKQLKRDKRTVILVSHDTGVLQEYCTGGILLEKGEIIERGPINKVVNSYVSTMNEGEQKKAQNKPEKEMDRWGSGEVLVENISIGKGGKNRIIFTDDEETIPIAVEYKATKDSESPVYGVTITDTSGAIYFQSNTLWNHILVADHKKGNTVRLFVDVPNVFNSGTYHVSPAVSDSTGVEVYDWRDNFSQFEVAKIQKSHGFINTAHSIKVVGEEPSH